MTLRAYHILAAAALLAFAASPASAQQGEKKLGWSDTAELSYVVTGGNSETQTLGFKDKLLRRWSNALFTLNAGAIRAQSTIKDIRAIDPDPNATGNVQNRVRIQEDDHNELTAENYFLNGRYDRNITEAFFWNAGGGWERNRFAGVENRYSGFGGVGNKWLDTERASWATSYSVTYTDQKDVVEDPNVNSTFLGFRVTSLYALQIGTTSKYTNDLTIDENADETKDLRADWTNSVAVSINSNLALKVSLQVLYDAQPALREVKVFDTATPPNETGATVLTELDKTDTIFTSSLVVNF